MKAVITGINGFIGSNLNKRLMRDGWETFEDMQPDVDYVFLFGSPSSNIWFNHALGYSLRETIDNFINAVEFCRQHKIKLVYPSSATVYHKSTLYARCKAILEEIHQSYRGDILGLRIFAGYGYEETKGDYASVVYQFCKSMLNNEQPVIYGDGEQTRDFVYIDDIVDQILSNVDKSGIIDIGTGINTSFNRIVQVINDELGKDIAPIYVKKPFHYVEETVCENPFNNPIDITEGVRRICETLME